MRSIDGTRRARVFLWVFVAVQLAFVAWLLPDQHYHGVSCAGLSQHAGTLGVSDYTQCVNDNAGGAFTHTVGLALKVLLWATVDALLTLAYVVLRVLRRFT